MAPAAQARAHVLAPYLSVLRLPHAPRLVVSGFIARIPYGITPLATVLLVRKASGSFADAGAVAAAQAVGWAAIAPLQGRLVDRAGQRMLLPAATVNALMLVALVVAAHRGRDIALLAVIAAIGGAATPPLSASMRAIWVAMISDDAIRTTAFALETVVIEVGFIVGPLLIAALVVVSGPSAAVLASAGLMFCGTLALSTAPPSRDWAAGPERHGNVAGPLASVGVRTLIYVYVPTGLAFGVLAVVIPGIATSHHDPAAAGLLSAAFAAGSLAGGLWYGSRPWHGPLVRRYVILAAVFAAGLAPLLVAGGVPIMSVLLALAGASLAPVTACLSALIEDVSPPGTTTEAFSWTFTSNWTGAAIGSAVGGTVLQNSGIRPALFIAVGGAAVGAAIAAARRATLRPRQPLSGAAITAASDLR
jgi:MFS family permease